MIRFKTFRYSLGLLIISAVLCGFWQRANAQVVEIPDPNLERAIREELGLPSEVPVTQEDMLLLDKFTVRDAEIEDLTGLEYATRVREIYLESNQIRDITPLAGLTNLKVLYLSKNPISDLSPLSEITSLQTLALTHIPIQDLSILSNLTQLEHLGLLLCELTDITALANLTKLRFLDLAENQIVDIGALANLTALRELRIHKNLIVDFSPIQGIPFDIFRYDQVCVLPDPPVQARIGSRTFPSIVQLFGNPIVNLPALSHEDRLAYHDLWGGGLPYYLCFQQRSPWSQLVGEVDRAVVQREELLTKNPNMIFLVNLHLTVADTNFYPENWFGWLRDENGNRVKVKRDPSNSGHFIDFIAPEVQDVIVQQAISVAQCGLYDGIMFDSGWSDTGPKLVDSSLEEWERQYYRTFEQELEARVSIIQRIRANVPDDFLILCNSNWAKLPITGSYINGGFMETFRDGYDVYQNKTLAEIEDALLWYEANVREPRINCLRGEGIPTEPPDSPTNRRFMRLFTTMSLTLSDGYALYTTGTYYQDHFWYPFWDADLGRPVGPKTQRYQADIESLYIREFTNGWAVYNRSGEPQTITLPSSATPVSDRVDSGASTTHQLPNHDGEIYLKTKNPADVNGDWVVNILDLVHVANNFGKADPDLNGDGVVNILDLTLVAKHLSQNAAAPSQLALIESIPATAKEVIAVQRALAELEAIPNKSHSVQIAIELLRHYLSIADPNVQETKLLSNYPNPFNPDTWIPYQLSEESTVTVKIYDVTGSLVRTIQVGHKPAGYYHTRERAIYWDGRNQNREPVSSGVYFYTLNTDTYTQTRRMVILK